MPFLYLGRPVYPYVQLSLSVVLSHTGSGWGLTSKPSASSVRAMSVGRVPYRSEASSQALVPAIDTVISVLEKSASVTLPFPSTVPPTAVSVVGV